MNLRACFLLIASALALTSNALARDPNPLVEAAILRLEARGAIVKPFRVAELDLAGTLVRLGDENDSRLITAEGGIEPAVIADLKIIPCLLLEIRGPAFLGTGDLYSLKNIIGLDVAGTTITCRGLEAIGELKSLRMLDLSFNLLEGRCLTLVGGLDKLQFLSLIETDVNDGAVRHLIRLKSLRTLQMQGTRISHKGREELVRQLPACQINIAESPAGVREDDICWLIEKKWGGSVTRDASTHGRPAIIVELKAGRITDYHMRDLGELKQLRRLAVDHTKITDDGLRHIASLSNLRELLLSHTQITSDGLKELEGMQELEFLDVWDTFVTNRGLKHLARLTNLKKLLLAKTSLTDAGLKELAPLKKLQHLDLRATMVSDRGMKDLAVITSLESLDLTGTFLTDAGLEELRVLKKLRTLSVHDTRVTDEGVAKLQERLPELKIGR